MVTTSVSGVCSHPPPGLRLASKAGPGLTAACRPRLAIRPAAGRLLPAEAGPTGRSPANNRPGPVQQNTSRLREQSCSSRSPSDGAASIIRRIWQVRGSQRAAPSAQQQAPGAMGQTDGGRSPESPTGVGRRPSHRPPRSTQGLSIPSPAHVDLGGHRPRRAHCQAPLVIDAHDLSAQ